MATHQRLFAEIGFDRNGAGVKINSARPPIFPRISTLFAAFFAFLDFGRKNWQKSHFELQFQGNSDSLTSDFDRNLAALDAGFCNPTRILALKID